MQGSDRHMLRTISLTLSFILLISSTYQEESPFYSAAAQVDIKGEMLKYQKLFSEENEYRDLCSNLEKYMIFWKKTLSVLNEGFDKDEELNKKIYKQAVVRNQKVRFPSSVDNSLSNFARYLNENGLGVGYEEWAVFLYFDPLYMCRNFKDILPDIVLEYFKIESEDLEEGYQDDGALRIPWDQLRIKVIRYERYLNKLGNIDCQYIKRAAEEKMEEYLATYLSGLPNSWLDEHIEEAMRSYERFLKENSDSEFYEEIRKHYSYCKEKIFLIYLATLCLHISRLAVYR